MENISIGKEAAMSLYESRWWEGKSAIEIAVTQLQIVELITEFGVFHAAVEEALGRPVFTHEFAFEGAERMFEEIIRGGFGS